LVAMDHSGTVAMHEARLARRGLGALQGAVTEETDLRWGSEKAVEFGGRSRVLSISPLNGLRAV
jgi:hypothetical protein